MPAGHPDSGIPNTKIGKAERSDELAMIHHPGDL